MEGSWSPHLKSELVEKCAGRVEPSVKNQQLALRLFGALPQKNWMLGRCCEERISKKVCGLFSARLWEPFYVCSVVFFCAFFASFNICSTELHLAHGGLVRFVGIELLLHELGKLQVALKVPAIHLSVLVLRRNKKMVNKVVGGPGALNFPKYVFFGFKNWLLRRKLTKSVPNVPRVGCGGRRFRNKS